MSNRKSAINLDFDNKQNIDESIQNTENITTLIWSFKIQIMFHILIKNFIKTKTISSKSAALAYNFPISILQIHITISRILAKIWQIIQSSLVPKFSDTGPVYTTTEFYVVLIFSNSFDIRNMLTRCRSVYRT